MAYTKTTWADDSSPYLTAINLNKMEQGIEDANDGSVVLSTLNATGSAPVYACRAWVNFNGTGTVAIRDSGNVSSITDEGTGKYSVNFATAMEDINYAVSGFVKQYDATTATSIVFAANADTLANSYTTSKVGVRASSSTTLLDAILVSVAIFR